MLLFSPIIIFGRLLLLAGVLVFNIKGTNIPFASNPIVHLSSDVAPSIAPTNNLSAVVSGFLCYSVCECPKTLVGR